MSSQYDAIIIGTGQAGPALADRMNKEGQRVAIVERDRVGGTCVNVGCIPTKALVASARAAYMTRRAADFGIHVEGRIRVDMRRVNERMLAISEQSRRGLGTWIDHMQNVDLIRADARFVGPRALEVNGQRIEAERVFLNVGTRAVLPEVPGLDQVPVLTSTDALQLTEVPRHLLILGGSYIGLEFAQIFRRFGSEVTIIERGPRVIGREDTDISASIREQLEAEGIRVLCDAGCLEVAPHAAGVQLQTTCYDNPRTVIGSHLLVAVGRMPNTDSLNLASAGIETDQRGFITVDDQLRTSAAGVWALGDCNGKGAFTHTSYNDHEIVVANLFDNDPRRVSDRIPCYGLFTDPPLGRVGMTEDQARASGRRVLVGKWPMSNVGRARERSETHGFIKILVDADTEQILGAAILGINGDEVVHSILATMYAGAPYTTLARAVHIHPTVSELIPTTLQNLIPLE